MAVITGEVTPSEEVSISTQDIVIKPNICIVTNAGFVQDVITDHPDLLGTVAVLDVTDEEEDVVISETSQLIETESYTGWGRVVDVTKGDIGDVIRKLNESSVIE